jgi:subtilisin family serine protease
MVMTLVAGQPAGAGPEPSGPPASPGAPAADQVGRSGPAERSVTLVTGDRVLVGRDGVATRPVPGAGRGHIRFSVRRAAGHSYVVPSDALPMLTRGRLDWRLFDVTGLLAAGYDDAHRADTPLIVRTRTAGALAARTTRRLSTLDVQVVRAAKDTRFWAGVRTDASARVWLDGLRRPLLDRSVAHIGAPAAWAAGWTGAGVSVAVLDTGIDAGHPDLADRVVDARNFTEDPDPADTIGHGTHVAATIAGTGVAAGGRYRGVAHGAGLLDGKVCESFQCPESAILAGMQWAAAEKGATVVNLSLGGPDQPGIDPLEEAVNRLTAEYGTLFVVASGNLGQCSPRNRVASPGTAAAALTVGATDLADRVADFTCTGPTIHESALKPDISAPGVGIVAARVPGTPVGDQDPVDPFYARSSGTSMATPHVAGAAAILAQQHPDWRADRLKAALMGAATAHPAHPVYEQGAGRVDVARAVRQAVTTAPASLGLGRQAWPHTDDEAIARTLTYRNDGPADATLTLRLTVTGPDGRPAPAGMFALSAATLAVPAGGEAGVTLTADTRVAGPDGGYTGRVVATDGATVVGTPVAVEREVESYDLTVRALDRAGAVTDLWVGDVYTPDEPTFLLGGSTVRLPRRGYEAAAFVFSEDPAPSGSLSLLGTHIELTRDLTVTFDSRRARPVEVVPPRAGASLVVGEVAMTGIVEDYSYTIGIGSRGSYENLFSGHIGASGDRKRLSSYVWGAWGDPGPAGDYAGSPYLYNLAWFKPGRVYTGFFQRPRDRDLAVVRSEFPTPPGRVAERFDWARQIGVEGTSTIAVVLSFALPAVRTEYFTTGVEWQGEFVRYGPSGYEAHQGAVWRRYHRGAQAQRWGVGVLGPALPEPYFREVWVRQFPDTLVFAVPMYTDGHRDHYGGARTDTARTTLHRDGVEVASSDEAGYVLYQAPAAPADLRVETTATQSVYDTSTEIRASWRFRTTAVSGPDPATLPVLAVRFRPELDNANSAPGGRRALIPVTVQRQPGAPEARVTSLTVDVSYDDGRTWRPVRLRRDHRGWLAPVDHPAGGFVSLRASAADAQGNRVDQTIIRAYRLR